MKLVSWNVNGFRACLQKGFEDFFKEVNADVFCLQETKMQPNQADFNPEGYHIYYHSAIKKGYSGTAVFTKTKPLSVTYGINGEHLDDGRVITLEFDNCYLVNCYTPNAQAELARIEYRMQFEDAIREYMTKIGESKPVIYCGDLNVAHKEIDLKNPKSNVGNPGFSPQEREKFTALLDNGFVDSFRSLYPDLEGAYSWWSYRFSARQKNIGWRIDYVVVSKLIENSIKSAVIYKDILGSDHCPVGIEIDI